MANGNGDPESAEQAHGERVAMTAVLADRMGELRATTSEGFASLHRALAEMNRTLTEHGERLTRLETQRETAESMDRRWEDRNQGRREGDQARAGLSFSKWQTVIAGLAVMLALVAIVIQAVIAIIP